MTKAERIYKDTKYACKKHIETWGFDNVGFTRMVVEDEEELIYKRTVTAIKNLIEKDKKYLNVNYRLGVITLEEAKEEAKVLKMVELTLGNQYVA